MRIGIDARLINYRRGIGNYVYHTVQMLAEMPSDFQYVLYVSNESAKQFVPQVPNMTVKTLLPAPYALWEQVILPMEIKYNPVDLLFCPANTAPLVKYPKVPIILTVHDVMYLLPKSVLPESVSLYQRLGRIYRKLVIPHVINSAEKIITVSNYSRSDIINNTKVAADKIHVIYEAPGSTFRQVTREVVNAVTKKYNIEKSYIVALGAIDPRKNTHTIIQSFAKFLHQVNGDYYLLLLGLNRKTKKYFLRYADQLGISSNIKALDFVSEEELIALYNGALFFLYPSLYEGFGLPLLEAMACGTPVISSARTSIPEIAGNAALLVDPTNVEAILEAMARLSYSETTRLQYVQRGFKQVKQFSWEQSTAKLLAIFEQTLR